MLSTILRRVAVVLAALAGLLVAVPVAARATVATDTGTAIPPRVSCAALARVDLSGVHAQLTAAVDVRRQGRPYCLLSGVISPQTRFRVLLPERGWRGDYLQEGCGGLCGRVELSTQPAAATGCAPVQNGELVLAADDQGHQAPSDADGRWAKDNLLLRAVFGYSSEHSLAQAAKAVVRAFYGRSPARSYFDGCSDGGHEALALAQRYPTDFDGILAGAPANNWAPLLGEFQTWAARANMDAAGHQVLPAEKLPALHAAVMAACANGHGVIADPRACTFDPATIACPTGVDTTRCLTAAQVRTVRLEYRGPTDARGRNLFDGGEPYGSELAWTGWMVGPATDPNAPGDTYAAQLGLNYLKYMAYFRNPPDSFTIRDFRFTTAEYQRLEVAGGLYNATNPDLRAFRAHGGKLIIYHGWADQAIPPFASINYYAAVARELGGFAPTQRFSRLYLVPGAYHCLGGGDPAVAANFLGALVDWVEHGRAPGAVRLPVQSQTTGRPISSLSVAPANPLTPAPRNHGLNSDYHYVGVRSAYRPGTELWCHRHGGRVSCDHRR